MDSYEKPYLNFWPLIIHSLERIDTVSNAMDLRGFERRIHVRGFIQIKRTAGISLLYL